MLYRAYCLVIITEKDERIMAVVQFKIKLFDFFSTSLNSSLIIFIQTYRPTVNYRNALDRLRVRMNIILLSLSLIINRFSRFNLCQINCNKATTSQFHIIMKYNETKRDTENKVHLTQNKSSSSHYKKFISQKQIQSVNNLLKLC